MSNVPIEWSVSTPQSLRPAARKSGYLVKEGGEWKTWKNRLFILTGKHLFYFKNENSLSPSGVINIEGSLVDREFHRGYPGFSIHLPSRTYRLYDDGMDGEKNVDEWVNAIKVCQSRKSVRLDSLSIESLPDLGSDDTRSSHRSSHSDIENLDVDDTAVVQANVSRSRIEEEERLRRIAEEQERLLREQREEEERARVQEQERRRVEESLRLLAVEENRRKRELEQHMDRMISLLRGYSVMKVAFSSNRIQPRFIFLNEEKTHILWGSKKSSALPKIPINSIRYLVYGGFSRNLKEARRTGLVLAPIFNFVSIFSELGRSYDFQFESSRDAESFYLAFQGFMPEKFLSHGRILYTRSQLLWKRLRLYVESRDLTLGAAFRRAVRAIVPSEFPSSSSSSSLSPRSTPSPPTFLSQNAR